MGRCLNGVRKGGHAEAVLSAQLLGGYLKSQTRGAACFFSSFACRLLHLLLGHLTGGTGAVGAAAVACMRLCWAVHGNLHAFMRLS